MEALILLLLACTPAEGMKKCDSVPGDEAREDCRLAVLWRLADAGDFASVEAEIAKIPDATARDLARVRLAKAFPKEADRVCAPVVDASFKEKCKQVTGRPHLTGAGP